MASFINKPIIRELVGSLAFAVVLTGTAPTIANHLEATEYVQDLFQVKTIGEYVDKTRGEDTSLLKYHVRACYEIFFRYTAPSTMFDASALVLFAEVNDKAKY
ncbi:hypothetical protein [Vibrio europaeus]|uniref:Uncharacterized protein n=1 Tax=Vibrio europaeus TaxID=300876 RepID=A0ABT5GRC5_9VIBR|nr:hypothetical protein [Vibrio europaeus]MDC5725726.1 hypothetical protein [Vibrio europaeus]MDC5728328.1 hypothetical protein [Vibrio europaeus]MDC5734540.1 hypothetical protein [Vibrio europaeus]MDC5739821.1 hypothetical protein [Vibrio europaeus]